MSSDGPITFHVVGTPVSAGSHRAFVFRRDGKTHARVTHASSKTAPWMDSIAHEASRHVSEVTRSAVELELQFVFVRPRSHYRSGRSTGHLLTSTAPRGHTRKPDLDKLCRCVSDGLTGVVWVDDSQVVRLCAEKSYGQQEGVTVTIREVCEQ